MPKATREPKSMPVDTNTPAAVAKSKNTRDTSVDAAVSNAKVNSGKVTAPTVAPNIEKTSAPGDDKTAKKKVNRGLAATVPTTKLKERIWIRALLTANRFRVIRTLDVAVVCFAERNYKAALTASQRAIRGMVKADLLRRYRTDRFQHICGITARGVEWLEEAGYEAASSVRRVSGMTNPEHRLWAQFWTLACEARGLRAMSEQELLKALNKDAKIGKPMIEGLLTVTTMRGQKAKTVHLRPDAVAFEAEGLTWCEIDRSKRGSDREASLGALLNSVGRTLKDGTALHRVVVFCKTERILKRAVSVINGLADASNDKVLIAGRRHFLEVEPGMYAVWAAPEKKLKDGRTKLEDALVGFIHFQLLPIWLPKVRIDASNTHSLAGWFGENYLPYKRPPGGKPWGPVVSPLLSKSGV